MTKSPRTTIYLLCLTLGQDLTSAALEALNRIALALWEAPENKLEKSDNLLKSICGFDKKNWKTWSQIRLEIWPLLQRSDNKTMITLPGLANLKMMFELENAIEPQAPAKTPSGQENIPEIQRLLAMVHFVGQENAPALLKIWRENHSDTDLLPLIKQAVAGNHDRAWLGEQVADLAARKQQQAAPETTNAAGDWQPAISDQALMNRYVGGASLRLNRQSWKALNYLLEKKLINRQTALRNGWYDPDDEAKEGVIRFKGGAARHKLPPLSAYADNISQTEAENTRTKSAYDFPSFKERMLAKNLDLGDDPIFEDPLSAT